MESVAFAVPILPGKTDADREYMRSATGDRKAQHAISRDRHGINREAVWIQQTPAGDVAVVYLEADDIQVAFGSIASSQEPYDVWFRDIIHECHGIDLAAGMPPPESVLDYRRGAS